MEASKSYEMSEVTYLQIIPSCGAVYIQRISSVWALHSCQGQPFISFQSSSSDANFCLNAGVPAPHMSQSKPFPARPRPKLLQDQHPGQQSSYLTCYC